MMEPSCLPAGSGGSAAESMMISLIRPFYHSHLITPPLGLGYLSSYLKAHGYETRLIDGLNLRLSATEMAEQCRGSFLVGITCLSAFFPEVAELTKKLKERGLRVAIGGPHAGALPAETLAVTGADFVVVGEGESTLLELLRALEKGEQPASVPGVAVPGGKAPSCERAFVSNLDSLPFPDWKAMDPRTYSKAPHGGLVRAFPVAPVTSTRGCPFACSFCASPRLWKKSIRFRSPGNVVDEIEMLVRDFGVREIHFEDDNLTLRRSHIDGLCREILKRKIRIHWATPNGVRIDTLDEEVLRLMRQSGCYFLAFGIESGSQAILDRIHKQQKLPEVERIVKLAHKLGFLTQGFFIFGLPGETPDTVEETIAFAKRIPLDRAQFLLLDLFPGSALWEEFRGERAVDGRYRSYQEATWVPPGFTREELNKIPGRAFRSFFLRPGPVLSLLKYARLSQLPFILRRMADFRVFSLGRS